jgi:hypothetical protein
LRASSRSAAHRRGAHLSARRRVRFLALTATYGIAGRHDAKAVLELNEDGTQAGRAGDYAAWRALPLGKPGAPVPDVVVVQPLTKRERRGAPCGSPLPGCISDVPAPDRAGDPSRRGAQIPRRSWLDDLPAPGAAQHSRLACGRSLSRRA